MQIFCKSKCREISPILRKFHEMNHKNFMDVFPCKFNILHFFQEYSPTEVMDFNILIWVK